MSITSRRTEKMVRDIIYDYISEGVYPPLHVVLRDLARRSREDVWKESSYAERGVIISEPINKAINSIVESLSLLYEELYSLHEEYEDFHTLTRNEYRKIATLEKKLEVMLDDIIHSSSSATSAFHSWGDSLNDLSKVDQNLTTAHVRLESGEAHLHLNLSASKEVTLQELTVATPTVFVSDTDYLLSEESVSYVSNAFDQNLGTAWIHEIRTGANIGVRVSLALSASLAAINHVEVEPYALRPMLITCYGVQGDGNVVWGKATTTAGRVSFGGLPNNVSSILIEFYKDHYDFMEEGSSGLRYVYRLGASEIILRAEDYETSSDLVSIPITIPKSVSTSSSLSSVSLEVDESIPPGTRINYFIGIEPEETPQNINEIIWNPISPANKQRVEGKAKTFFLYPGASHNTVIEPEEVLGEGIDTGIYRITDKPGSEVLLSSLDVFVGWDQGLIWRNDNSDPMFLHLSEWRDRYESDEVHGAFFEISSLGNLYLPGKYSYMIEIPIEVESSLSTTTSLYVPTGWQCSVYVNSVLQNPVSLGYNTNELSITLKQGTNWLHMTITTNGESGNIRLGTDLNALGRTYLWHPLVTSRSQIGRMGSTYYATWDGGLIINFDPATKSPNENPFTEAAGYYGVVHMPRFWFNYYEPGVTKADTIRFRAQLQRDIGVQASPALKEYHVRMNYGE